MPARCDSPLPYCCSPSFFLSLGSPSTVPVQQLSEGCRAEVQTTVQRLQAEQGGAGASAV